MTGMNRLTPMKKAGPIGVFETFVPGAKIGQLYKFFIVGMNGEHIYKADPYANEAELRPGTASRITDIGDYKWKDTTWMKNRQKFDETKDAMSIYEVHPGSWMKHPATEENEKGFYQLQGTGGEAGPVCEGYGLYTCGADGNCRASI